MVVVIVVVLFVFVAVIVIWQLLIFVLLFLWHYKSVWTSRHMGKGGGGGERWRGFLLIAIPSPNQTLILFHKSESDGGSSVLTVWWA